MTGILVCHRFSRSFVGGVLVVGCNLGLTWKGWEANSLDSRVTPVKVDSEHINEEALFKADIVLNHYFIKTRKAYENRIKKAKNKERGWNCPGWDYLGFVKRLYNIDEKYLIEEP